MHTWFWLHQTKVRNLSFLLSTIGKGGTRNWTRDLLICSQMLYHWAIPPIHQAKKQNKINYILHWKKSSSFPSRAGFWLSQNSIQSKRGTRIWTGKLFMCSQMLYYWAIPHAPKTKARKLHTSFWQHQQPHFECSKYSKSKGGSWIWTCKSLYLPWFEVKTLRFQGIYILNFDNIKQQQLHFEVRTLVFPKSTIFKGEKLVTTFSEDLVLIHRKEIR